MPNLTTTDVSLWLSPWWLVIVAVVGEATVEVVIEKFEYLP